MHSVNITKEPVELYKILKFENLCSSGGEAKLAIANGHVLVNGEIELRKRKKIYNGDVIHFDGDALQIVYCATHSQTTSPENGGSAND
jgi:ribosome-associated protein